MKPEILENKINSQRQDSRVLDAEGHDVVKEILQEQGLLQTGQTTILYD